MREKIKKNKKKVIIAAVAIVLIIALVIIGVFASKKAAEEAAKETGTIEAVTGRSIANSVSCSGVVTSSDYEEVAGSTSSLMSSGEVKEVYVEVGDRVKAGDKIAQLDTEDLEENLSEVNKQIADTRESQSKQDAKLDKQIQKQQENLDKSKSEAEAGARNAYTTYYEIVNAHPNLEGEIEKAEEEVSSLNKEIATLQSDISKLETELIVDPTNTAKQTELASKKTELETKQSTLKTKQENYTTLMSLKTQRDTAQTEYNTYSKTLEELNEQDTSELQDSKKEYDDGIDDQVESLTKQKKKLEKQIKNSTLYAHVDGTVTSVNSSSSTFGSGTIAVIENEGTMIVEAQVSEYDVADIEVGMNVLMRTDSTRDEELSGVVMFIAPRATSTSAGDSGSSSGIDMSSVFGTSSGMSNTNTDATYLVKIALDEQNERLRLGMNAKVSILEEEKASALSVPQNAVLTDEDGSSYVRVITSGNDPTDEDFATKNVKVKVGIQGNYYVEITGDGIKEGTKIFVPASGKGTSIEDIMNNMGADAGV